jgi:GNAT superfamily N-acetyltransferase
MSLKDVSFDWISKKLDFDTAIKPFESEDDELNRFLLDDAKNYLTQMLAVTYLIENDTDTIAYFCISNDNLKREIGTNLSELEKTVWNQLSRKIPNRKRRGSYPAVKIGRLAVSKKYAGKGFGKLLIDTVGSMYLEENQRAGCRFITVDANANAFAFYEKNGFGFITDKDRGKKNRAMYFDLKATQ